MDRSLITSLILACAVGLPAVETHETQTNYMFDPESKVVPRWCTSILIATASEKVIPFILVGKPAKGELILVQPDDDLMSDLMMGDEAGAELFDYEGLQGSFIVDFGRYSGGTPRELQLGLKHFDAGRPSWYIEVDEVASFKAIPPEELNKGAKNKGRRKKNNGATGGEKEFYTGILNGRLRIGEEVVLPLAHKTRITLTHAKASLDKGGEGQMATMEFSQATIAFHLPMTLPGKTLGWSVPQAKLDFSFYGYADVKKGTDNLFKENLPTIQFGP